ncbi:MAG: ROK family protein [Acidimicrobiales bacterium]
MNRTERLVRENRGLGLVRALNEQRVLEVLLRDGPLSRPRIATRTGLSKPTVSSVIQYLEACGLARPLGRQSGAVGRPSLLYEAVARAGHVFAADIGGTKVRAGLADSYGEVVVEVDEPTVHLGGQAVVDQVARMFDGLVERAGLRPPLVWAAGVGVPGVYDPDTDHVSAIPNLPRLSEIPVAAAMRESLGIPVAIDNDVNLAAAGERWRGLASDCEHFVAISIGTGIGMGIVINGEIYRGSRGAAGEIDFLPIGGGAYDGRRSRRDRFSPDRDGQWRGHGPLESASTGPAMLQRLEQRLRSGRASSLTGEDGVVDIFRAAESGDGLAAEVIDEEARTVALAIVTVAAVLDPQLVVLGGGVASNPGLLEPVRRHVARLFPRPLEIRTSALGDAGAFHGAIAVGLRAARQQLLVQMADSR